MSQAKSSYGKLALGAALAIGLGAVAYRQYKKSNAARSGSGSDSGSVAVDTKQPAAAAAASAAGAAPSRMRMDHITFTGADDKSSHSELINFLRANHKTDGSGAAIEIGFLVSRNEFGTAKYPTHKWIEGLSAALASATPIADGVTAGSLFSVHVCNEWAAELAESGSTECFESVKVLRDGDVITRVQLNFSRSLAAGKLNASKLLPALARYPKLQFIFQLPSFDHYDLVLAARKAGIRAFGFFDPSAGMGITPKHGWPKPPATVGTNDAGNSLPIGYAGGLGPNNLLPALKEISNYGVSTPFAAGRPFWVDMETNVRTNNEFDLSKVLTCVNISKPFF